MNLLETAWIPVRRAAGQQDWIAPWQITEPDIVALDSVRADFNGALIQFLIGLIQTTTPMDSHAEWQQWNDRPPSAEQLKEWFTPVFSAFEFTGDGARFMQDFSLRTVDVADKDFNDIGALLIESPGENTLKENKDHFIKRGFVSSLCPCCAATALFTLQTNAPSGGNGHYTSIRGGGPLTTLVVAEPGRPLWNTIWLNVRERSQFIGSVSNESLQSLHHIFPWLAEMDRIQPPGGKTAPVQVHPFHVFWGMPRRIRLDLDQAVAGHCGLCGRESDQLITRYLTKAKGFDYKGAWNHPLSPYYENKPGEFLPVHPGPDGFGYKHWLGWVLGSQRDKKSVQSAAIVSHVLGGRRLHGKQFRLWAFGYDMDKMKARCWYESTFPLYGLPERDREARNFVQRELEKWLDAADLTAFYLQSAVRSAWLSDGAEARGDWSFVDATFWSVTEPWFYRHLQQLIDLAREDSDEDDDVILLPLRKAWHDQLTKAAMRLFDADLVGAAPIDRQNPRRVAEAEKGLRANLWGKKLKNILKLPDEKSIKANKSAKRVA